jgi:hypothetical protein
VMGIISSTGETRWKTPAGTERWIPARREPLRGGLCLPDRQSLRWAGWQVGWFGTRKTNTPAYCDRALACGPLSVTAPAPTPAPARWSGVGKESWKCAQTFLPRHPLAVSASCQPWQSHHCRPRLRSRLRSRPELDQATSILSCPARGKAQYSLTTSPARPGIPLLDLLSIIALPSSQVIHPVVFLRYPFCRQQIDPPTPTNLRPRYYLDTPSCPTTHFLSLPLLLTHAAARQQECAHALEGHDIIQNALSRISPTQALCHRAIPRTRNNNYNSLLPL